MPRSSRLSCLLIGLLLVGTAISAGENEETAGAKGENRNSLEYIELKLAPNVTMELVKIPSGKFLMGTGPDQQIRIHDDREQPRREVTIGREFFMGTREVTRGQFAVFVEVAGYLTQAEREGWTFAWNGHVWDKVDGASWRKVGFDQTDEHPVVCVSFDDAVAFCRWLTQKTGRKILLPTEAQWEYAARAAATAAFPWGDKWEDG
ncbi:MAG: formylglycine-generating enzyme family protein, partial [Planctomycetes bacterium]|nr:formylglycine-generating enzyme family protein [Planctomycetota bacterium]